ncbi:MAG: bifunctional hydroxymethylpyrimidine kinase/phosphomethylpyrimidine kinase [Oligoflexia bacterium]|nr:bifunctional hydroxymethylpyrimidine kinase/phosphomethylpyrimidine kinase [Oligoflexia bacterium]
MNIISIQSHVSYGHAGNSASVFPLHYLGFNVWPVHAVNFSNHASYGKWEGVVFDDKIICDPAMGDTGRGVFVKEDIPGFLKGKLVPVADIITPNHFEFNILCGGPDLNLC